MNTQAMPTGFPVNLREVTGLLDVYIHKRNPHNLYQASLASGEYPAQNPPDKKMSPHVSAQPLR